MLPPTAAFAGADAVVIRPMTDAIKAATFPDVVDELASEKLAKVASVMDCEDTDSTGEASEEATCTLVPPNDETVPNDTGASEVEAVSIESVSRGIVDDNCAVVDPNGSADVAEEMLVESVTT